MAKNWNDITEAFVHGFVNAYNVAATQATKAFDCREVEMLARNQAAEHVAALKHAEAQKKVIPDAPLDEIFESKK